MNSYEYFFIIISTGPNQWRDNVPPKRILYDVCKRNNLPLPELLDDRSIKIGDFIFHLEDFGLFRRFSTVLFSYVHGKLTLF